MPRRLLGAAVLGALAALAVDLVLLVGPAGTLVDDVGLLGSFYDVQARAFLDGRLDVEPASAAIEGFMVDGRTYLYFGPVPALLRLPVLVVTDGLDGRLTQLSMLAALVVLLGAGARLQWAVMRLLRPGGAVTRADAVAVGLLQLGLGAGAIPLYLVSRPVVYHETELWGAAFALAALALIVDVIRAPSLRRIALAGVFTALAVNTRLSVGLAPVLALSVLGIGCAAALAATRLRGRPRVGVAALAALAPGGVRARPGATLAALALAAAVPMLISAAVNMAKFDRPFGIPLERQVASRVDPQRRAALAANPDGLFGARFVPTTLVQAVRPDAVGTSRAFPFVGLPATPARVLGDVRFDTVEPSLSAPTSMALFCLLTMVGAGALLRRRAWALLGVLAASAGGFAVTLTIAYVTTRYLADLLPFLFLGASIGCHALLQGTGRRLPVLALLAAGVVAGIVVNGAVGVVGQRLVDPDVTPTERASFVRFQDEVDEALGRTPRGVRAGARLPPRAPGRPGDLFVLGRCAGLYARGLDGRWLAVERTAGAGVRVYVARFPATAGARPERLLAFGSGARAVTVVTADRPQGRVFSVLVAGRTVASSPPLAGLRGRAVRLETSFDEYLGRTYLALRAGSRIAVTAPVAFDPRAPGSGAPGRGDTTLAPFSGRLRSVPLAAPACREITRRIGL